jgi:uncharacterized protein with HEPN domain
MAECIARIDNYAGRDRTRFLASTLVQDGVVRSLQTLTESSQRLSGALQSTEPDIPWRKLAGLRNILVHAYLAVDLNIVWSVVEDDLPSLAAAVHRVQARLPTDG